MICLDNTDTLEGGASIDAVVDYTVHGLVGTTFTNIAQGQLSVTDPSVLYTAGAAISIVSVTMVNTHSAAVTVNLYLDPANGATPRRMIPKNLSLAVGYSLHFDGARCTILDVNGGIVSGLNVSDTIYGVGWDGVIAVAPSKNALYDKMQTMLGDVSAAANIPAEAITVGDGGAKGVKALALGAANLKLFMNAAGTANEYASGMKTGTTTRDMTLATGTQEITGIGFKPSNIIFFANRNQYAETSIGFDNGSNHYCINDAENVNVNTWQSETNIAILLMQTAAIYYTGRVSVLGSDGFTISWTKVGAKAGAAVIHFIAFR